MQRLRTVTSLDVSAVAGASCNACSAFIGQIELSKFSPEQSTVEESSLISSFGTHLVIIHHPQSLYEYMLKHYIFLQKYLECCDFTGETQIDVRMVFPWREYARFEYLVRAPWPLDKQK